MVLSLLQLRLFHLLSLVKIPEGILIIIWSD